MKSKIPAIIIAFVILAAVMGSSVLCFILSRSIETTAVRIFVSTFIYRIAFGEAIIVILGIMGLLFSLHAAKVETEKSSAEKNELQAKTALLEEELEKNKLNFLEAEEALEELTTIRELDRKAFSSIQETVQKILEQVPGLEKANKDSLGILEETLNRLESLQLPQEVSPQSSEPVPPVVVQGNRPEWAAEISEGIRLADELKMKVHEGSVQANGSRELIIAIAEDVKKITAMAETINHISAQTNILSMNAAIESAHAGPAGVGFAVVADEIKKLAESTALNTKQIQTEIKAITEKTRAGVKSGEASFRTMEALGGTTEEMEALLNALSSHEPESAGSFEAPAPSNENQPSQQLAEKPQDSFGIKLEELKSDYRTGHVRIKTELATIDACISTLRLSLESIRDNEAPPAETVQNPPVPPSPAATIITPTPTVAPAPAETSAPQPTVEAAAYKPTFTLPAAAAPKPSDPSELQVSDSRDVTVKEPPRTII